MKNPKSNSTTTQGFIKMMRAQSFWELIEVAPLAFVLAAAISQRARWSTTESLKGLQPGECLIGDHKACGMSRQQYRTAKAQLEKWRFATFKTTMRGTRAKLIDTRLFDVLNLSSQPSEQPPANHLPTISQPLTKNGKNGNTVKKGKDKRLAKSPQAPISPFLPECRFPATVEDVLSFGRDMGCDEHLCHRFIHYNNRNGWQLRASWQAALIGFRESCDTSPGEVSELPIDWVPEIIRPDEFVTADVVTEGDELPDDGFENTEERLKKIYD